MDITSRERKLLAHLRWGPGMFLREHSIKPEGLNEFTAVWFGESLGGHCCFTLIAEHEPDDAKALERFFEILDAYLVSLGYEPLPMWNDAVDPYRDHASETAG